MGITQNYVVHIISFKALMTSGTKVGVALKICNQTINLLKEYILQIEEKHVWTVVLSK